MLIKNTAVRLISINTKQVLKYAQIEDPKTGGMTNGKIIGAMPGETFKLMPAGKAVEVDDEVCVTHAKYLRALHAASDISFNVSVLDKLTGTKTVTVDDDIDADVDTDTDVDTGVDADGGSYDDMTRDELIEVAEAMNIKLTSKMKKKKDLIIEAIESV